MDMNEIRTLVRKAAQDAVAKKAVVGERVSHGEPGEGPGDDVKVVKNEKICFTKWLKGIIWNDWVGSCRI